MLSQLAKYVKQKCVKILFFQCVLVIVISSVGVLARPQDPFFEFGSFQVPAVGFNSKPNQFSRLSSVSVASPAPSLPLIKNQNLFTLAGPPYSFPTPQSTTVNVASYPTVSFTQTYTPAPTPIVRQSYTHASPVPTVRQSYTPAPVNVPSNDEENEVIPTKMTPFVDLGLTEDAVETKDMVEIKDIDEVEEIIEEIPKSSGGVKVNVLKNDSGVNKEVDSDNDVTKEKHVMTKNDLIQMAMDRLKDMEDKLGNLSVIKKRI